MPSHNHFFIFLFQIVIVEYETGRGNDFIAGMINTKEETNRYGWQRGVTKLTASLKITVQVVIQQSSQVTWEHIPGGQDD